MRQAAWMLAFLLVLTRSPRLLQADGPADNVAGKVRPIPPPGIALPPEREARLTTGLYDLDRAIEHARKAAASQAELADLLPDVLIYARAVRTNLEHHEFFSPADLDHAENLVREGIARADALAKGSAPWTRAAGPVVRGYRSRIDGSVQPYGLVVPAESVTESGRARRLDVWFHGRNETLSETNFIAEREAAPGLFTPPDAFVLHPYGRYCNASKFAGEVDFFEALAAVRRHYRIDEDRIAVRGFSMGGAACWHIGVHFAGQWAAMAPGAGFAETTEFLKVFQHEPTQPPWYERKLLHWYDATDYALNISDCPTIAYSGELDPQKQAAEIMERAAAREGIVLTHVVGPKTQHAYEPGAKKVVEQLVDRAVLRGRAPVPRRVRFTTWTLKYNRMHWIVIDALSRHWERALVEAELTSDHSARLATRNVAAVSLEMAAGDSPLDVTRKPEIAIDDQVLAAPPAHSDRSWQVHLRKQEGRWQVVPAAGLPGLHKRHGLQGPIDDAFMDRFIMVTPTGTPLFPKLSGWVASEQAHALEHWRRQFRGEPLVKPDRAIDAADIASSNLILWGDPGSNSVLAQVAAKLPITWNAQGLKAGPQSFDPGSHAPLMIYPNPLNPARYVVLNSGFTYREYDDLNNARQVPKLPDWAIVDPSTPADFRRPGKVAAAGFFGENWELNPKEHEE